MAGLQNVYKHLVARPHPWRKQLYLQGRNMTVGQLIAAMHANKLSLEETAEDFSLPIAQVEEALAYYEAHRDLVNAEPREETRYVQAQGYNLNVWRY